jgi:hypothetical protein
MNPDSVLIAIDTANYFAKNLPYIIDQLCILKPIILGLVFLLCADFATGVRKARHLKEKINSRGFRRTLGKFNDYSFAIVSSQVFTWSFSLDFTLSYYVALFVCGIELKSIWENVSETTGVDIIGYFKGFLPNPKDMFKKKGDNDKKE